MREPDRERLGELGGRVHTRRHVLRLPVRLQPLLRLLLLQLQVAAESEAALVGSLDRHRHVVELVARLGRSVSLQGCDAALVTGSAADRRGEWVEGFRVLLVDGVSLLLNLRSPLPAQA